MDDFKCLFMTTTTASPKPKYFRFIQQIKSSMADSNPESDTEDQWTLYNDRPEWNDIEPLPQDEGPTPVVCISYTEKFKNIQDYMRAVLKKNEMSERAFHLTTDAVSVNSADYTAWQYRRELLKALGKNLLEELDFVDKTCAACPKNYQVWHHRQVIVEWLDNPMDEMQRIASILDQDSKNYHAWQHRQWLIRKFNLYENELDYVNKLINEDIRNNSAWNQRYFIIKNKINAQPDVLASEMEFTFNKIKIAPLNESPWNYLRGLLRHHDLGLREPTAMSFCKELYNNNHRSIHLLGFLIDIAKELAENGDTSNIDSAKKICNDLANTYDKIRMRYWQYIATTL